jgi:carboxymethylenebutenolidase
MTRFLAVLAVIGVPLCAQDWARQKLNQSPRHHEWAKVQHDGRSVDTFIVYPESKQKTPVVLIIHEIFGESDWIQELADEVAAAGYVAVAPDLLSGTGPNGGGTSSLQDPTKTIRDLPPDQITADLNAAADYAVKLPAANGKLFVAGFCWGGSQSFRYATNRTGLSAAFVFYGTGPDKNAISRITAPVYGFYAGNDARVDATLPDTTQAMKAAGKKFDPVTYEGAGHGFMRAGEAPDATDANKKARDEAWARWKTLLKQHS